MKHGRLSTICQILSWKDSCLGWFQIRQLESPLQKASLYHSFKKAKPSKLIRISQNRRNHYIILHSKICIDISYSLMKFTRMKYCSKTCQQTNCKKWYSSWMKYFTDTIMWSFMTKNIKWMNKLSRFMQEFGWLRDNFS